MGRRRRRSSRGRRGNSGLNQNLLYGALAILAIVAGLFAAGVLPPHAPKPVKVYSETDVFVIDSTSHDQATVLTREKIFDRMVNPFGSHVVEGEEVKERGTGLAAEISVIVITSQTNLAMRQDIVTRNQIDDMWDKLLGTSNYSRAEQIYKSFMSPSSSIWGEVVKQYFLTDDALPSVASCQSELQSKAASLSQEPGNFAKTLGYLDRAVDGGKSGAWEILCGFAYDMKRNYLAIGQILDLASNECHDGKTITKDRCSDIPGATKLIQSIQEEKWNWLGSEDKSEKRFGLVCAYFGSDMITNSEDNNTEYLDLHTALKQGTFPRDEISANNLGVEGAKSILGTSFGNRVKVRIYAPNVGDTRDLSAKIGGIEGVNFVERYWTSYFKEGFGANLSNSSYGCEGQEFNNKG